MLGLTSTVSLEPIRSRLMSRWSCSATGCCTFLAAFDPDIAEHFKVLADLEDDIDRTPATEAAHARLIAALKRHGLQTC